MSAHIHFLGGCEHSREVGLEQEGMLDGVEWLPGENPAVRLGARTR